MNIVIICYVIKEGEEAKYYPREFRPYYTTPHHTTPHHTTLHYTTLHIMEQTQTRPDHGSVIWSLSSVSKMSLTVLDRQES